MRTKRYKINALDYPLNGAVSLREAAIRDIKVRDGDNVRIKFYYGLPDGRPVTDLSCRLLIGEPEVIMVAEVSIPDPKPRTETSAGVSGVGSNKAA